MFLSTLRRVIALCVAIIAIFTVGVLVLGVVFQVENPFPWMAGVALMAVPMLYLKIFQLPYIKWKDSYYVGVEEIDYDHKQLVGLINQVVTASHDNLRENIVPGILDNLIDYTKYHLDREEKLMEKYGYPDHADHSIQHEKFINKISRFHSKFDEQREMKTEVVFDFLRGWLLKHISNTDKELGAFIKAKRANEEAS